MSQWTAAASVVLTALGVVAGAVTGWSSRDVRLGLRCALDFWLGAGLIRLTGSQDWQVAATAAVVLAIRQVVGRELRRSATARAAA